MFSSEDAAPTKSERTRAQLRDLALASFRERGYDATTIRLIAQEAGVSVGTTHYHFASKSDLVQELYLQVQQTHRDAALPLLEETDDLVARLGIVFRTGITQLEPFHAHASEFLPAAMTPKSEINPLSTESTAARDIVVQLFAKANAGAKNPLPKEFEASAPTGLFLAYLLLTLFWVYDSSPGQKRTGQLLDRGLGLLKLALPLTRTPLLRRPLRELLDLIVEVGS